MHLRTALLFLLVGLMLSACGLSAQTVTENPALAPEETATSALCPPEVACAPCPSEVPPAAAAVLKLSNLADVGTLAIKALAQHDFARLAELAHPQKGIRFSPYPYVSDDQVVLTADELSSAYSDTTSRLWGHYDGSGEPIQLTFAQYFERFIYSADFANPEQIGYNKVLQESNSINNIPEYYPQAEFVEYHFSGFDPQYEGMDWQSLRLVFEKVDGRYYLVGIVHAQWTI